MDYILGQRSAVKYAGYIAATGITVAALIKLRNKWSAQKERVCGVDYPKDTVILHQTEKTNLVPSLGHFVMKLETYLRVAIIPFKPEYHTHISGPRNKIPWIEYNGRTISDSQLIIEFLNKELNINLDANLTISEQAMGHTIQRMLEECTYWYSVTLRWHHYLPEFLNMLKRSPILIPIIRKNLYPMMNAQGSGRYTCEEVETMMMKDVDVLAELLGKKKYILGGDSPTTYDCAIFGQMIQYTHAMPETCPVSAHIRSHTNLMDYVERIKSRYWQDWKERTAVLPNK